MTISQYAPYKEFERPRAQPASNNASFTAVTGVSRTLLAKESGLTVLIDATFVATATYTIPTAVGNEGATFHFTCIGSLGENFLIVGAVAAQLVGGFSSSEIQDAVAMGSSTTGDTITLVDAVADAGDYVHLRSNGTNWEVSGHAALQAAILMTT